jgi:hypothetical protein
VKPVSDSRIPLIDWKVQDGSMSRLLMWAGYLISNVAFVAAGAMLGLAARAESPGSRRTLSAACRRP